MNQKERQRIGIMIGVKAGELSLVEAMDVLGLGYRQTKRVWRRYRADGDKGLVHRLRGKPGLRRKPAKLRARILARVAERYPDFGPTLAAEYLAKDGLVVDHDTLRCWLLAEGKRTVRRRRQRHRQWRERKPCFGTMVQLDGSHHDWFEGRRGKGVLMVMVDDATNRLWAQFFEEETTHASYDVLEGWCRKYGLPQSLYVDRDSIYRCEGLGSIAEQIAGKEPQTQFGRAMEQLGVELILANSPQAKGRVVQRDWTVACSGKRYQLDKQHEAMSLAGKKVIVRTLRDGRVQLERGGVKLRWRAISGRPVREKAKTIVAPVKAKAEAKERKPGANHPWRRQRIGSVRKQERLERGACLAVGDSGRPSLRSGLPASPTARHGTKKKPTNPGDIST